MRRWRVAKKGFHEALKAARVRKGWTKYRLAKALGVSSALNTLKLVRLFPELLELVNGGDGDAEERKER
jgi:hypothetical protein